MLLFQVGSYFVGQYYEVLQTQPDFAHQFYTDASTMLRVDGDSSESASATLVMLLIYLYIFCLPICTYTRFLIDWLEFVFLWCSCTSLVCVVHDGFCFLLCILKRGSWSVLIMRVKYYPVKISVRKKLYD